MKNPVLRPRALERLYQKALRFQREDAQNEDLDPDERAKEFVRGMSGKTQVLVALHVQERHGLDALDEFSWLLPPLAGCIFMMSAILECEREMA